MTLTHAGRAPVRAYHGTSQLFDKFSLDYAARPDMCSNGHLGVWLAVDQSLAKSFGAHCLEVDLRTEKPFWLPYADLVKMHRECQQSSEDMPEDQEREHARLFYTAYREKLLSAGFDIVYLVEDHGGVDMVIGLVPDRLSIVKP